MSTAKDLAFHLCCRPCLYRSHASRIVLTALLLLAFVHGQSASAQGGPSVVVTGIETMFNPSLGGYDITAYLSVLDAAGTPVAGLEVLDLTLNEDGQEIEEFVIEPIEVGLSMILAIDTSGSMASGGKMAAVKEAATAFIQGLKDEDEIGLISFNEQPKVEINITHDRAAVQNFVDLLQPMSGAATCLWDSAYEAIELASATPAGRRAVVLLTDGIDELGTGGPCSTKTLEDVIALATDPAVLVPTYTVGIGNRVDSPSLSRLSDNTGGRTSFAVTAASVGDIFNELGLQFRGGYALHYRTDAASGEHSLFVQVEYEGSQDQDTRRFRIPELIGEAAFAGISQDQVIDHDMTYSLEVSSLVAPESVEFYLDEQLTYQDHEAPYQNSLNAAQLEVGPHTLRAVALDPTGEVLAVARIGFVYEEPAPIIPLSAVVSFVDIEAGQRIEEPMILSAAVESNAPVARVEFRVDEILIGEDAIPPFEVQWDPSFSSSGEHALSVVAIGPDDSVLASDEVRVIYAPSTSMLLVFGIPALLVAAVAGSYLLIRRRRAGRTPSLAPTETVLVDVEAAQPESAETLAAVVIEECHDPNLVDQRYEIWEERVLIGRSSECDIVIPLQPVSRIHATIRIQLPSSDAALTVDEIMLEEQEVGGIRADFEMFDGDPRTGKGSTYGTFVDEVRVQPEAGLPLSDGSRIRLGRSLAEGRVAPVILRFEDLRPAEMRAPEAEMTADELIPSEAVGGTGMGLDSGAQEPESFETEDFSLNDENDDLKTEEFGPDADL